MHATHEVRKGFPTLRIATGEASQPIEVHLIAQLAPGSGDALLAQATERQREHPGFLDALDEPSVRLAGMHLAHGDPSSLYSFSVGPTGHPFHRHASARIFTAIAGSAGARLRFSCASDAEIAVDPCSFVRKLHDVHMPADSLFTVRFGGGVWHQFLPARQDGGHGALFALSCHPDELGGSLDAAARARVLANEASIPGLTETLPDSVLPLISTSTPAQANHYLGVQDGPDGLLQGLCARVRRAAGRLRSRLRLGHRAAGFVSTAITPLRARHEPALPARSRLPEALATGHDDCVVLELAAGRWPATSARGLLLQVLAGFVENPPTSVGLLMRLRNRLVGPLGLRTAELGCPVSSLQAKDCAQRFGGRFPVLARHVDEDDRWAEVILGADDRHLVFRSSVSVCLTPEGSWQIRLASRVQTRNLFGAFYMFAIRPVHERHVAPTMLEFAVHHALGETHATQLQAAGA